MADGKTSCFDVRFTTGGSGFGGVIQRVLRFELLEKVQPEVLRFVFDLTPHAFLFWQMPGSLERQFLH
jgi:hypothetical protein